MDRGQDEEVKSLLQQILASQQRGQQDVLTVKRDTRFVKSDIEATKNNIKHVKTDVKDMDDKYDLRMKAPEEKYDKLLRQLGHGQGQAQGQGPGHGQHRHPNPIATTTTTTSTTNKVVIGGWTSPQLQRVVEDRLHQLCSDVGITPKDFFARKGAAVGFVCCENSDDMHTLVRHIKNTKPLTNVLGDNGAMWAKQSRAPEERARILGLRCAARSFFSHFEGAAGGGLPPADFVIDYYRMEIVIGTDVPVSITDGAPNWRLDALHKHVRGAKDDIIKNAEDFVTEATTAAE